VQNAAGGSSGAGGAESRNSGQTDKASSDAGSAEGRASGKSDKDPKVRSWDEEMARAAEVEAKAKDVDGSVHNPAKSMADTACAAAHKDLPDGRPKPGNAVKKALDEAAALSGDMPDVEKVKEKTRDLENASNLFYEALALASTFNKSNTGPFKDALKEADGHKRPVRLQEVLETVPGSEKSSQKPFRLQGIMKDAERFKKPSRLQGAESLKQESRGFKPPTQQNPPSLQDILDESRRLRALKEQEAAKADNDLLSDDCQQQSSRQGDYLLSDNRPATSQPRV
jgi:hypothetical protein